MRKFKLRRIKRLRYFRKKKQKELKKRRRKLLTKRKNHFKPSKSSKLNRNIHDNNRALFTADTNFSIVNNPLQTIKFFTDIHAKFKQLIPVYLDVSNVEEITIDALLYLLAIIDRMKFQNIPVHIQGNLPTSGEANSKFSKSGFLRFVKSNLNTIERTEDCVQIFDGYNADSSLAKKFCLFTMDKLSVDRNWTKVLYDIVMEIIINTRQHAYAETTKLPKWYAYAWFNSDENEITFTLLDTGAGIPATVRKGWSEKLSEMVAKLPLIKTHDSELLLSVLNGDFRTKTKAKNRGKGIPKIKSYNDLGNIFDLTIVSNHGFVSTQNKKSIELSNPFNGTLYSWRIKK